MKRVLPVSSSSSNRFDHSSLNRFAPVKLPSPPITTRFVIFLSMRFEAAFNLPGLSLKSLHLALPMNVPPCQKYQINTMGTPLYVFCWHFSKPTHNMNDIADFGPSCFFDEFTSIDHSLIPLSNDKNNRQSPKKLLFSAVIFYERKIFNSSGVIFHLQKSAVKKTSVNFFCLHSRLTLCTANLNFWIIA